MRIHAVLLCITLFFINCACAGIQIDSTRVIYPAAKREVTLSMVNDAHSPRLLQSWIDNGDPDMQPDTAILPFIVTPPVFRLDPGKGQTLRIVFTGDDIPKDRESVYWLNVLEIQPKPAGKKEGTDNFMQFSVRTRLKIFYRPQGLSGSPQEAVGKLHWRLVSADKGHALECDNPSAFNVSFNDVRLKGVAESEAGKQSGMCPARGKTIFPVKGLPGGEVAFITIDDYGGYKKHEATFSHWEQY